jgi:hypothetical protein
MASFTRSVSNSAITTRGGGARAHNIGVFTGDFFLPSFRCPHRVERIGIMGDGGKWVCGLERIAPKSQCRIYSFGAMICRLSDHDDR